MPHFIFVQEPDGLWKFQLLTATGKVLLYGNPYPIRESCKGAALSVKLALDFDDCVELLTNTDRSYSFTIRSLGDQSILGVSEKYPTKSSCIQAMKIVREEIKIAVWR